MFGGGRPLVLAADAPCSKLVPQSWLGPDAKHAPDPTPAPPEPVAPAANAGDKAWSDYWRAKYEHAFGELKKWIGFAVAESQNVEDEHGRVVDSNQITSDCEKRDAAAVAKASKRGLFN